MWYNGWLYSIILARLSGPPAVLDYPGGQQKMLIGGDEREDTYRKANTTFFLTIPTTA